MSLLTTSYLFLDKYLLTSFATLKCFSFLLLSSKYFCILDKRLLSDRGIYYQFRAGKNDTDLNTMFLIYSLRHPSQGATKLVLYSSHFQGVKYRVGIDRQNKSSNN